VSRQVVLASRNPAKVGELERIVKRLAGGITLLSAGELTGFAEVAETGATFAENALLKARAATQWSGLPSVADDSGLCIEALGGMPGVLSARWAGRHGDDQANLRLVLEQLADTPDPRRSAKFVCAAALVMPDGGEYVELGVLAGAIARAPRGGQGFGYDPIFLPAGLDRTTAELTATEKDAISHRGQALRALAPFIGRLA
jgi:XTP/dITP diphosphohydrolase